MCVVGNKEDDFAFVEIYLSPNSNLEYTMKFCFPGENYGLGRISNLHGDDHVWPSYNGRRNKIFSKSSSSTFLENETIDKGNNFAFDSFDRPTDKTHSKLGDPLELFSSGTHVLVRFYSSDGRFPSKGFRAKYKTGK